LLKTTPMRRKYPIGIQDFYELRTGGYIYVDKTHFVYRMIEKGKFYFLSRPRRFGKSLLLSTLDYLFQAGINPRKKELFKGLYIEDKWDWDTTHPIIKISFSNISHKEKGLTLAIADCLDSIAIKYDISLKESVNSAKFKELIEVLSAKLGSVVILIDEYDKPIIDYLGEDLAKAIENRGILKTFYSILKDADPFIKLVFITGVSKFSRVSIFSDLNNLQDLTINKSFANCCGITQEELETNFGEELEIYDKEKLKEWYNGYSWDLKTTVYNPFSLLNFFSGEGDFRNFWFETGTPTFLINLSKKEHLYDFENQRLSTIQLSAYDLENLAIVPLMFQTGYLTLKAYDEIGDIYILDYPNKEVKRAYLEFLVDSYIQSQKDKGYILVLDMRTALLAFELDKLQSLINTLFKSIPYSIWQNENEHFFHAILHLSFRLMGLFVESEVQTSDGRIDALVRMEQYVYCFEFKLGGDAQVALQQILDKGYLVPYLHSGKKCIAIGVNFSKETKKIDGMLWEEILPD
jgi:hypothetical protein